MQANGQCTTQVPTGCFHPQCFTLDNNGLVTNKASAFYAIGATCTGGYYCSNGLYTGEIGCGATSYFNIALALNNLNSNIANTDANTCQTTLPGNCQQRVFSVCANKQNAYYLTAGDNNQCRTFYQCNNQQLVGPSSQTCTAGQYIDIASGTCVSTPPTGCLHPNCYTTLNGVFNGFKTNGGYTNDNTCLAGYVCNNGLISQVATCTTNPRTYYHSDTGSCQSTKPVNCIG
jgi:hypothetical protein